MIAGYSIAQIVGFVIVVAAIAALAWYAYKRRA